MNFLSCSLKYSCQGNYLYTHKSEITQKYGTQNGTKIKVMYKCIMSSEVIVWSWIVERKGF